jgi:hypothetical protein
MLDDLKFGLRLLIKSPPLYLLLCSLWLWEMVNTAVFSLLNALVFKPLPIANTEGLVYLFNSSQHTFMGTALILVISRTFKTMYSPVYWHTRRDRWH